MNTFRASFNFELHWHPLRCRRQSPFIASTENSDKKQRQKEKKVSQTQTFCPKHRRYSENREESKGVSA